MAAVGGEFRFPQPTVTTTDIKFALDACLSNQMNKEESNEDTEDAAYAD